MTDQPVRKIIQISAIPETDRVCATICALFSDGFIWVFSDADGIWKRLPDIPQTPLEKSK